MIKVGQKYKCIKSNGLMIGNEIYTIVDSKYENYIFLEKPDKSKIFSRSPDQLKIYFKLVEDKSHLPIWFCTQNQFLTTFGWF